MQSQKCILCKCYGFFQICGLENSQYWPYFIKKGLYHFQEYASGAAGDGKCSSAWIEVWWEVAKCGRRTIFSAQADFFHFWVFEGQIGGNEGKEEIQLAESSQAEYFAQAKKIFNGPLQRQFLPKNKLWDSKIGWRPCTKHQELAVWQRNWDKIRKSAKFEHFIWKTAKKA